MSVVMWASLALRDSRKCLFMTPVTWLSPRRDLGNSAISSADAGSKTFSHVWLQSDFKEVTKDE